MYRVRWSRSALTKLADIWSRAEAAERKKITEASAEIDWRLERNPLGEGESREKIAALLLFLLSACFFVSNQTVEPCRFFKSVYIGPRRNELGKPHAALDSFSIGAAWKPCTNAASRFNPSCKRPSSAA